MIASGLVSAIEFENAHEGLSTSTVPSDAYVFTFLLFFEAFLTCDVAAVALGKYVPRIALTVSRAIIFPPIAAG